MSGQLQSVPEDVWILVTQQLWLTDIFALAQCCQTFAKLIGGFNWSQYYRQQIGPTISAIYDMTKINRDFMQTQGCYLIKAQASAEVHRRWLKLYPLVLKLYLNMWPKFNVNNIVNMCYYDGVIVHGQQIGLDAWGQKTITYVENEEEKQTVTFTSSMLTAMKKTILRQDINLMEFMSGKRFMSVNLEN